MMQLFTQPGVSMRNWLMAWKTVALGVGEVDQLHHRVGFAGDFVQVHLRLEEKRLHRLVGLQQRAAGLAQDLVAQIVELAVGEPGPAVGGEVD